MKKQPFQAYFFKYTSYSETPTTALATELWA